MLLVKQDITKRRQLNDKLVLELEFEVGNDKEYEVEAIKDSAVYVDTYQEKLPKLYYLISWKGYPESESNQKSTLIIMHLWKIINTFYKNYLEKSTAISLLTNSALPMTRLLTNLLLVNSREKRKQGYLTKNIKKSIRK